MSVDGGLRSLFRQNLKEGFQWTSVESGTTGSGIPDSEFCCNGESGWIEYKLTSVWAIGISAEQCAWHRARYMRGGRSFIAIRRKHNGGPRKGPPVDSLYIYSGQYASFLRSDGLKTEAEKLGYWVGSPRDWDWSAIRQIITG